ARPRREDFRGPAECGRQRSAGDRGLSRHRRPRHPGGRRREAPLMLTLGKVDAGYGSFQALFGIDLGVRAGEAVGGSGPNGPGKTTLMRVISGLIRPRGGSVAMEGADLVRTPAHRIIRLGIAHVPENRRLFPRLTVEDNLKMGAFMPEARAKHDQRLDFVFTLFPRMKERRHQMA